MLVAMKSIIQINLSIQFLKSVEACSEDLWIQVIIYQKNSLNI